MSNSAANIEIAPEPISPEAIREIKDLVLGIMGASNSDAVRMMALQLVSNAVKHVPITVKDCIFYGDNCTIGDLATRTTLDTEDDGTIKSQDAGIGVIS